MRFSDIFIKRYGLNIEIDGGYHGLESQKVKDDLREKEIWDKKRIITVRFTNDDIFKKMDEVTLKLDLLISELDKLPNWKSPGKGKKRFSATMRRKQLWREYSR